MDGPTASVCSTACSGQNEVGKMKAINQFGLKWRGLGLRVMLAGLLLLIAAPALAQGCALCYTQAASSGAKIIAALKSGILILVIPPTLGSIGMIFVLHRRRNQVRSTGNGVESGQDW